MGPKTVLIVGGVAGGASCAARLRRLDEGARIVIFEKGPYISFANCGLPYHIGGVIEDRSALLVQTPERFQQAFRVETRLKSEVVSIDRTARTISVREAAGRTYSEPYDYLVLSPGAEPVRPRIDGADLSGVFTLRNMDDMDAIMSRMNQSPVRRALVVGGGYVGLEVAENFRSRGADVAVVEKLPQVVPLVDPEIAAVVHEHLRSEGVPVWLGDAVKSIAGRPDGALDVTLASGRTAWADVVVISVGVRPDVELARAAGIELGSTGAIKVDPHMRTNDEHIYAVGDAVEVTDIVTGRPAVMPLAGPANRQGRIAADNICGRDSSYRGSQGTAIVKVFGLAVGATGANERTLKSAGIPYCRVHIHPMDHAGYYPGAQQIAIKAIFRPDDGKLLGAQVVGKSGVDKRVDVLATALRAGLTVYDLEHLELAYAPPYGSAKDPVNMVGFVASNILRGDVAPAYWDELRFPLDDVRVVLDVRTREEWDAGHVPGAVHIPVGQLRSRLAELPKNREVLVYCGVGIRSYAATRILMQNGFRARNLSGGFRSFRAFHPNLSGKSDIFAELKDRFCQVPLAPPISPDERH